MPFFEVNRVSISFGGLRALEKISFTVDKGEVYAIIGPNGAGKTTMFNCINGIYSPDGGDIRFKDRNVLGKKPDKVARMGIARTFQNIELFSNMNAMENIMLGRHIFIKTGLFHGAGMWGRRSFAGREEVDHRRKVEEIIDFLEIEHVRKKRVGELPYGLQKRIDLGRAMAMSPDLLLLDEPMAGMNLEEKEDMARFILDIHEEWGTTIVLVEHDMGVVMDVADRLVVFDFGQKIAEGTPDEISKNPKVIGAYLGGEV